MPINYRFRWIPFVATLVAMAVGIALGHWQMRRAAEKKAIEVTLSVRQSAPIIAIGSAALSLDAMEFRRARVKGEFVRAWPVYLDNRPYQGTAGFYVLMPFKIAGSDSHILVARGWVARDPAQRAKLPALVTPAGIIDIEGMVRRNPGRLLQLGPAEKLEPYAIVQNADIDSLAAASTLTLQPFLLEQASDTGDALVRAWPRPSSGMDKHLGYAFQWYGLAAMALIFFVVTGFRRGTK